MSTTPLSAQLLKPTILALIMVLGEFACRWLVTCASSCVVERAARPLNVHAHACARANVFLFAAFSERLYSVLRFESIIHEFDPVSRSVGRRRRCSANAPSRCLAASRLRRSQTRFLTSCLLVVVVRGCLARAPHAARSTLIFGPPSTWSTKAFTTFSIGSMNKPGELRLLCWLGWLFARVCACVTFCVETRYPLGRIIGGTVYPGIMMTAAFAHWVLHAINITIKIRNICVFTAPVFSAFTAMATYLFTSELRSESGKQNRRMFNTCIHI